jgi:thymidine kinase
MDTRFIDYRYICGRDNFTCVFCHRELEPSAACLSQLEAGSNWNPSNVVVTCDIGRCAKKSQIEKDLEGLGLLSVQLDRNPNLPSDPIKGRLIVLCGSMFSEKTTTTRSQINKYKRVIGEYIWVKPDRDDRGTGITTHNQEEIDAHIISWQRPDKHLEELRRYGLVALDEVQFYSERILYVVHQLLKQGTLVIVNGLKLDFQRNPFGIIHYLLAEADDIVPLKAVCNACGMIDVATRTKKRSSGGPSVETGGADKYYAICPRCDARPPERFVF